MNNIKAKLHFTARNCADFVSNGKIRAVHPIGIEIVLRFKNWILSQDAENDGTISGVIDLHDFDWNAFRTDNPSIDYRLISPRSLSLSYFYDFGIKAVNNGVKKEMLLTEMEFIDEFNVEYRTSLTKTAAKIA